MRLISRYTYCLRRKSKGHYVAHHVRARGLATFDGKVDRYNGVTIDIKTQIPEMVPANQFHQILKESLKKWRSESRAAIWLEMPIKYCSYVEAAAQEGFEFHYAEHDRCVLKLWLREDEDGTPRFATHQLGVCGVVVREDTREVLVIQERKSAFWKFPGGLADLGENISDAAVRETFEETGIKAEFQSVICFRQQHQYPGIYGRSDMYVVCRLKPLSFEISPCDREILDCRWMPIQKLREDSNISGLTVVVCDLIQEGLDKGFSYIDITGHQMKSPFKGRYFTLFKRYHWSR